MDAVFVLNGGSNHVLSCISIVITKTISHTYILLLGRSKFVCIYLAIIDTHDQKIVGNL